MPGNLMANSRFSFGESSTNPVLMTSILSWGKRRFAKTGFDVPVIIASRAIPTPAH
jgi:hypothetical protein